MRPTERSIRPLVLSGKSVPNINQNLPKSLLLVGDIIYDIHHHGVGKGISIEAPVPLGLHHHTTSNWGGAGLVARNLLALGTPVFFLSIIGVDSYDKELLTLKDKYLTKKFFVDKKRHTIVKERFVIAGKKILRWNRGDSNAIDKGLEEKIFAEIKRVLPHSSLVLISDYRHGLLTKKLAQKVLKLTQKAGKEVWVDSQVAQNEANHKWYEGANLFCLNQKEAASIDKKFDKKNLPASLKRLQKILNTKNVTIKLGARGSASFLGKEYIVVPAQKVKEVDAVGAGDAFFAALASRGVISKESLSFASKWAGLAVTISGTEPPKRSMLKDKK